MKKIKNRYPIRVIFEDLKYTTYEIYTISNGEEYSVAFSLENNRVDTLKDKLEIYNKVIDYHFNKKQDGTRKRVDNRRKR